MNQAAAEQLPGNRRPNTIIVLLALLRPANLLTAHADILAGVAIAGIPQLSILGWLLIATTGLYGGGVVLNDVCDAALDARERPERPIPSGRISRRTAAWLGGLLLIGGVVSAGQVGVISGVIAGSIALLALIYDLRAKHHPVLRPVTMGACRGLNLVLGMSAAMLALSYWWWLGAIPLLYIAMVTLVSAGEVHGGQRRVTQAAVGGLCVALVGLGVVACSVPMGARLPALAVWGVFIVLVLPPYWRITQVPEAHFIRRAVKTGVLSLILLNAVLATAFVGVGYGLLVLAVLPLSYGIARWCAVT
ncbi:MAG: UbiA-like protein EboC [Armatimonadota bacterium]